MKILRITAAVIGLSVAGAAAAASAADPGVTWAKAGPTVPLTIGGHRFQVERALTADQQEQGLMFRKAMPRDHGMIFPMERPRGAAFWMKNTYLPLDILFIGADRRIVQIAARAQPLSERLIECPQPITAVLELNGGRAAELGIKVGDKVGW